MKLPNSVGAVIEPSKLRDYVLNTEHKRGGSKAIALARFGFTPENWPDLEAELRRHIDNDIDTMRGTDYGDRYEIRMNLTGPTGRSIWARTIWQIDIGTNFPRLITLFPD